MIGGSIVPLEAPAVIKVCAGEQCRVFELPRLSELLGAVCVELWGAGRRLLWQRMLVTHDPRGDARVLAELEFCGSAIDADRLLDSLTCLHDPPPRMLTAALIDAFDVLTGSEGDAAIAAAAWIAARVLILAAECLCDDTARLPPPRAARAAAAGAQPRPRAGCPLAPTRLHAEAARRAAVTLRLAAEAAGGPDELERLMREWRPTRHYKLRLTPSGPRFEV